MRGEDNESSSTLCDTLGSPPHARGRHPPTTDSFAAPRITPACAGKTIDEKCDGTINGDHPRMRGEDKYRQSNAPKRQGSPPHARGRLHQLMSERALKRITPACAGKTITKSKCLATPPDHPRMRGEDPIRHLGHAEEVGSPPHARGRPYYTCACHTNPGITPACAGKTLKSASGAASDRDHPRMRGEDETARPQLGEHIGSPPHARGRRRPPHANDIAGRITPACAGKTGDTRRKT